MARANWMSKVDNESGFGLVEVLIATIILVIGVVALAGMTTSVATTVSRAEWLSEQVVAGQQALEAMHEGGYAAAASRADTVSIDGHDYVIKLSVTQASSRVKQVQAIVAPAGSVSSDTVTTLLYAPVDLPAPPSP